MRREIWAIGFAWARVRSGVRCGRPSSSPTPPGHRVRNGVGEYCLIVHVRKSTIVLYIQAFPAGHHQTAVVALRALLAIRAHACALLHTVLPWPNDNEKQSTQMPMSVTACHGCVTLVWTPCVHPMCRTARIRPSSTCGGPQPTIESSAAMAGGTGARLVPASVSFASAIRHPASKSAMSRCSNSGVEPATQSCLAVASCL